MSRKDCLYCAGRNLTDENGRETSVHVSSLPNSPAVMVVGTLNVPISFCPMCGSGLPYDPWRNDEY